MSDREHPLFSLLEEEGKVLDNLKFFPGDEPGNRQQFMDAAHDMLSVALEEDDSSEFPDAAMRIEYEALAAA